MTVLNRAMVQIISLRNQILSMMEKGRSNTKWIYKHPNFRKVYSRDQCQIRKYQDNSLHHKWNPFIQLLRNYLSYLNSNISNKLQAISMNLFSFRSFPSIILKKITFYKSLMIANKKSHQKKEMKESTRNGNQRTNNSSIMVFIRELIMITKEKMLTRANKVKNNNLVFWGNIAQNLMIFFFEIGRSPQNRKKSKRS